MVQKNASLNPECYGESPLADAITRTDSTLNSLKAIETIIFVFLIGFPIFYTGVWFYGVTQIQFGFGEYETSGVEAAQFSGTEAPLFRIKALEDFADIVGEFQDMVNWLGGDGLNFTDAMNYTLGNNTDLLIDIVDALNDTHPEITTDNILEYFANGTIMEYMDEVPALRGMIEDIVRSFWQDTIPNLIPDTWNSIRAFYIRNNNINSLTSWFTLTDVLLHADFTINDAENIIFHNQSDAVNGGEMITAGMNFSQILTGVINSTIDALVNITISAMSGEGFSELSEGAINIFMELIEQYEILFNINVAGKFHFYSTALDLRINMSDLLNTAMNMTGGS